MKSLASLFAFFYPIASSVPSCHGKSSAFGTKGHFSRHSSQAASFLAASLPRGGVNDPSKKKVKKKKKTETSSGAEKKEIDTKLKEKDAADALGDAIRSRAQDLLQDTTTTGDAAAQSLFDSVKSVGWALGATDQRLLDAPVQTDGAGVQVAATSLVAHYFLKSHGGAHALQCFCSLLASIAGLGALAVSSTSPMSLTLMKRCMVFAMVKHVSGMVAASILAAKTIPELGLGTARSWMEQLARDPVSQYVFYAACTLLWLPQNAPTAPLWWQSPLASLLLVGPILLREMVSTALVISDVLVLWSCSDQPTGGRSIQASALLSVTGSFIDAGMSVLVTPKAWRKANPSERQAILAKLTSRVSLAMELLVGTVMLVDALRSVGMFTFASLSQRPSFLGLVKRLLCTRVYLHFLWTRRRKIEKLATNVRGGATELPFYLLNVLMDPRASMGIVVTNENGVNGCNRETTEDPRHWTLGDYLRTAFDLDQKCR